MEQQPQSYSVKVTSEAIYISNPKSDLHYKLSRGSASLVRLSLAEAAENLLDEKVCVGFYGIIDLLETKHIICIDRCVKVGTLLNSPVYRVEEISFIQLATSASRDAREKNNAYISMIKNAIERKGAYFARDFALTKNVQSLLNEVDTGHRFFLNKRHCQLFYDSNMEELITPIIFGYFDYREVYIAGKRLQYVLISRKDVRRLGRRYLSRGLDKSCVAANFVETEQVITTIDGTMHNIAAYTQIRGSIPLLWNQIPNFSWDPTIDLNPDLKANSDAMKKHLDEELSHYSKLKLINLIDNKGSQKRIGESFTDTLSELKLDNVGYVWFDFHEECKKMRWENIGKLIAKIEPDMNEFGYFSALVDIPKEAKWKEIPSEAVHVKQVQKGVIRTNCMDSLDRTGVVQSVIARNILHQQLSSMKLESNSTAPKTAFEPFEEHELEQVFRNVWTDNGDQLSVQYSGSKALKTDFTRTGRRTIAGALWDGKNSIQRYYIGRFSDGYYQDSLELASGTLVPLKDEIKERPLLGPMAMLVITFMIAIFVGHRLSNKYLQFDKESLKGFLAHIGVVIVAVVIILKVSFGDGKELFDIPKRMQK